MVSITIGVEEFEFNDGDVDQIETSISNELDFEAMPGSPPSDAILFDFNGVTKVITVQGVLTDTGVTRITGDTVITIDEQRQWLEKALNGMQTGLTFTSNYSSTYNGATFVDSKCYKSVIRFTEITGKPFELPFTLTLFVGDV